MNYGYPNCQPYTPLGVQSYIPPSYQPYVGLGTQQTSQQTQSIQTSEPSIQLCDSVDYIKSQNVRLDGQPAYYALTDSSEIYCKRLNPQTGAGMLNRYKLVELENQPTEDKTIPDITSVIVKLQNDISEIKELVLDSVTKPTLQKGGGK